MRKTSILIIQGMLFDLKIEELFGDYLDAKEIVIF